MLTKPFLWIAKEGFSIVEVEIEFFPKMGEIDIQPEVEISGFSRAVPYVYRSLYVSLGHVDPVTRQRWFLPKQELTSIGNLLIPPEAVLLNGLNVWMRDGQAVRFKAYTEEDAMRGLRQAAVPYKQWHQVTDLYVWDAVAKTATMEIMVDGHIGRIKVIVPNGLTGSGNLALSCLTSAGTTLTSATNAIPLNSVKTEITLPATENWNGRITLTLSVSTGNFPESFNIYVQDK